MKLPLLLTTLLLSVSPAVAQYNADDDCVINKASEIQRLESELQEQVKETEESGFSDSLRTQLVKMGQLPMDASARMKREQALWFIEGSRKALQNNIDALKLSPDCSELEGGKGR